jgi:hypothetical protein
MMSYMNGKGLREKHMVGGDYFGKENMESPKISSFLSTEHKKSSFSHLSKKKRYQK